jgi:hypothetical protein
MAIETSLCLQVFEDGNCQIIRLMDCSLYLEDLSIESYNIYVTSPDFNDPIAIEVEENFNVIVNSSILEITTDSEDLSPLSDGIYVIKQIINEGEDDEVFSEYNYLRQCQAYCLYNKKLCALNLSECSDCNKANESYIKALAEVELYLKAAKAFVEQCNAPDKGKQLNDYAITLLNKINIDCTNCR